MDLKDKMEIDFIHIDPLKLKYHKGDEVVVKYFGPACNPMHLSIGIGKVLKIIDNSKPYVVINNKGVGYQASEDILCLKKDLSIEHLEQEMITIWEKKLKNLEEELKRTKQICEIVKKDSKKICQYAIDAGCDIDYRFV